MFAKRTAWDLTTNRLLSCLEELKAKGKNIIDLTESNPTRCGFSYPKQKILPILGQEKNLLYNPYPMGILPARQSVSEYYRKKDIAVSSENIFLTASTSEAYSCLFRLLLNPHEKILVPKPSYPLFEFLSQLNDVEIEQYPLLSHEDGWVIDLARLKNIFTKDIKAIILVNPNNPTGSYIKEEEAAVINQLCNKYDAAVIADEVFFDFRLDETLKPVSFAGNTQALTFTLSGISKILALPQMKLSWGIVSGPEALRQKALQRLEVILDTFLSVNTPVQNSLPQWLALQKDFERMILKHINENYRLMKELFRGSSLAHFKVEGGWYAVIKLPQNGDEEQWIVDLLESENVFAHPGYFFDIQESACIVVSLLLPPKIFKEGIEKVIKKLKIVV